MTRKLTCVVKSCGASPVITKPVPLCAVCGLETASQVVGQTLQGAIATARRNAPNLTAPPPVRRTQTEAYELADEYLAALKAKGLEWFAYRHVQDVPRITSRSRGWTYAWLEKRASEGKLVREDRHGQAGYRFPA